MDLDPIVLSIPVFFLLIALELLVQWWNGEHLYRANDAITNISCGIVEQVMGLYTKVLMVAMYEGCHHLFALWSIPNTWPTFLALIIGVDFFYYWAHRMSHEVNLFWGGHVVHHQSEDYNLSVALRQGSFQTFWVSPFYIPLAIIGFDTYSFLGASSLVTLYQFWIHTEKIGKLGWFEKFFNTPSHHRVHHGRDAKYIDRNHAGLLIIWDKMFGTFQEEEEHPTYGITEASNSWNPVWVNLKHYAGLSHQLRQARSWRERWGYLFRNPGWAPEGAELVESKPLAGKYDPSVPVALQLYLISQYLVVLGYSAAMLFVEGGLAALPRLLLMLFVVGSTVTIGGFFDRRPWAMGAELLRIATVAAVLLAGLGVGAATIAVAAAYVIGSLLGLVQVRGKTSKSLTVAQSS